MINVVTPLLLPKIYKLKLYVLTSDLQEGRLIFSAHQDSFYIYEKALKGRLSRHIAMGNAEAKL